MKKTSAYCGVSFNFCLIYRYVSKNHFGANAIRAQFEQEQQKIKGLMQVGNESVTDYNQTTTSTPSLASSTNVQLEVKKYKKK